MITLIHNGYDISFPESEEEVQRKIDEVLKPHLNLSPRLITDIQFNNNGKRTKLLRYKYLTVYEENFIIEYEN